MADNIEITKDLWALFEELGFDGGIEAFFDRCRPDAVFEPQTGANQTFEGVAAYRAHLEANREAGTVTEAEADSFESDGDEVRVSGWLRIKRADGSFADAILCWIYTFDESGMITRFRAVPHKSQVRA